MTAIVYNSWKGKGTAYSTYSLNVSELWQLPIALFWRSFVSNFEFEFIQRFVISFVLPDCY